MIKQIVQVALVSGWLLICTVASAQTNKEAPSKTSSLANKTAIPGELLVIAASEEPGKIDPALAKETALKHRSFRIFKTMKLVERINFRSVLGKEFVHKLPNGRRIRLLLEKIRDDGRYAVQFSINQPKKKDYLRSVQVILAPGVPVFQAGQRLGKDDLLLGIRLGAEPDSQASKASVKTK